jgi:hypothetical protein
MMKKIFYFVFVILLVGLVSASSYYIFFFDSLNRYEVYSQSGLIFGWDGSNAVNYVNTSMVGTAENGLIAGNTNNLTGGHVIDTNATYFNGTNGEGHINFAEYDFGSGEELTANIWFRIESPINVLAEYNYLFGDSWFYSRFRNDNGRLAFDVAGCTNYFEYDSKVPESEWYDWHMYSVRYKNATIWEHYLDGELIEAEAPCTQSAPTSYINGFSIGSFANSGIRSWNGTLDELHIWDRTLDAGEINALYNMSKYGALKLQTRTDNIDVAYANWSSDYLTNGSEYKITNLTEPYRYFQYKAEFETLDTNSTPKLTDVVLKQIDYKSTILNILHYTNFSLLYPENSTWINDNTTIFNITNASDFDIENLLFDVLIYNSTNNSILHLYNKTYNNYTLSDSEQLLDGNYTWKARLVDNSTIRDEVYEEMYTDWVGNFEFYLDTKNPTVTFINQTVNRTDGQVIIDDTSLITTGENLTLRFNIVDSASVVSSALIKIWQTVKDGATLFFGWLTNVAGDLWEITIPAINYTYNAGQVNYTLYVNDSVNNIQDYDGNFSVAYNTTLDVFFNYTNIGIEENLTLIINYNYTNNSAIKNAIVNITIFDTFYSTTYDDNLQYHYNSSIGNYDLGAGTYLISVNASNNDSYYVFRNNITSIDIYNDVPVTSIWNYPSMNTHMLYNNYTEFDWGDSLGHTDSDAINYEIEVYNSTSFSSNSLVFAFNSSMSNYTLPLGSMPPVGDYYLRYRANDTVKYNSYNYTNFSVAYATLNVATPSHDQILRKNTQYWFNVTELGNGEFVNNVSLKIAGATFTNYFNLTANSSQFEYTSYGAWYTIPNTVSQFVTITAYGWNGSIGNSLNSTDTRTFRIRDGVTTTPLISYFCPSISYITQEPANVTVRTSAGSVLVDKVNVSVLSPSGDTIILNATKNNLYNYVNNSYAFEYNFTFTPSAEGNYLLRVEVKDVNYEDSGIIANTTVPLYVSNKTSISFTSKGISNFTIKDICSNQIITKTNSSLSINEVPGIYNLELTEDPLTVLLSNVTLNGDLGEVCYYNDMTENLVVPENTRAVDQFNLSCSSLTFGWNNESYMAVNITYNYTNFLQRVTHEENLGAYKCLSPTSCNWNQLTSSVLQDSNRIIFVSTNFSVFVVTEDVTITTVEIVGPGSGSGGGSGGSSKAVYDLDIIEPGQLTILDEKHVTTQIFLKNSGGSDLYGIQLSANSEEQGLDFSFSSSYIPSLYAGQQMPITLTVTRGENVAPGQYDVNVKADVSTPRFSDQAKFIINLVAEEGMRSRAMQDISFAKSLFQANPICLELNMLIDKAEESFNEDNYEVAIQTARSVVEACKSLVSESGLSLQKPKKKILSDTSILIIEGVTFLFIFYGVYHYYRRRRFKKKNI